MAEQDKGAPATPRFMGPPGRLRLAGVDARQWAQVEGVQLPEALQPRRARPALRRGGDPARARLRLPPDTPPGRYDITLALAGGKSQCASVDVQARPRLRVTPSALRLTAAAGASACAALLLENRGNVPVEIGPVLVAGLFDDDGIEAAMASVYNLDSHDVNKIVGHAFSKLREAHGGLLKLRVRQGAGPLAVGERRVLELEARLGEKLVPGHGYHGVLEMAGHGIAVEVAVSKRRADDGRSTGAKA
ncbi:hypothetical protein RA210_U160017 [Rubrivivax sp. A210]|uniref:hypothetical protein n=1 Tax=Rubrivivax sp. A210 TaxID=2772301 RepID=UPI00191B23E8|nr:hypothetical protein [Rubrivivax sp. A210]CAD5371611.1 hypothetical protein RA210_U160017 [Rubrivivax sp. A210]